MNKELKLGNQELSKIEKKTKLNFFEKRAVRKMINKLKKIVLAQKEIIEFEKKERDAYEKELLSFTDVLEIENDDGELLNSENIKKLSNKEIKDTFLMCLDEMEKLI
jgi:hypothetical protein